MKKIVFLLSVIVLFAACKEEKELVQDPTQNPVQGTLKLAENDITVEVGETYQLMLDSTSTEGVTVVWSSDNTAIATVDDKGLVTAIAFGTTTVNVATVDGSLKASCSVNVVLVNQYSIKDVLTSIGSVVELDTEEGSRFALYEQEGVMDMNTPPAIELFVATDSIGKEIDLSLATDTTEVKIKIEGTTCTFSSGKLKVSFDRFKTKVIISLNAEYEGGVLGVGYNGAFAVTFNASGKFIVKTELKDDPTEQPEQQYDFTSLLCQLPAEPGKPTGFVFGNINATSAEDYKDKENAHAAVWITLSKPYQGTINVEDKQARNSFTLKFIDYDNEFVCDASNSKVTEGTITTQKTTDGKVYFIVDVTVVRNVAITGEIKSYKIKAEYLGEVTAEVEDLSSIIPNYSKYIYYNATGGENANKEISQLQYSIGNDGRYTFYFVSDEGVSSCPQLTVSPELFNKGEIDCRVSQNASLFKLKYGTISLGLQYSTTAYVPTKEAKLSISKDDSGNYIINLDMVNRYKSNSPYAGDYESGDYFRLFINYQGPATEKK